MEAENKKHSGWRSNAKWVVGLLCLPIFAISFLAVNVYLLTSRDNAIPAAANIIEALFLPNANMEESLVAVRRAMRESPDRSFSPFPGTGIKITEKDLQNYTTEELKERLFNDLAVSIYDSDESTPDRVGFLFMLTKGGHALVEKYLPFVLAPALLLLTLAIYFSAGFGRVVTPGVMALVVGVPGTALFFLLRRSEGEMSIPGSDAGYQERIMFIVRSFAPQFNALYENYRLLTLAGLALVTIGIAGGIIAKCIKKK